MWKFSVFNGILRLDPEEKIEDDPKKIPLLIIEPDNTSNVQLTRSRILNKLHPYTIQTLYDNIIAIHAEYPLFQRMIKIIPDKRCSIDDIITECNTQLASISS